jgi:hypothetical protein
MKKKEFSGRWRFNGIIILNFIFLSILLSCKKEDDKPLVNSQSLTEGITFRDGRLIFKDVSTFTDHQRWILENKDKPYLISEKNISLGLKSMTELYQEGMKIEENDPKFAEYVAKYPSVFNKESYDNSILYLLPHSKLLCYVANKDGIFQIGDDIFRVAGNYIYQTRDESKLEMLFLPKDQISDKEIMISLSQPKTATKNDYGNMTVKFSINDAFRIVSSLREYTIYDQNSGITFWYDDIITNPQHRVLGVWGRAQLATKAANDNGYFALCPTCTQYPISAGYAENTGLSQDVIYFAPDYQIDMSASYCPAYSRGRLIDESVQYVYIIWEDGLEASPTGTWTRTTDISDPY